MAQKIVKKTNIGFVIAKVFSTLAATFLGGVYLTVMFRDTGISDNAIGIIISSAALASVASVFIRLIKSNNNKFLSILFCASRYIADALLISSYLLNIKISIYLVVGLYFLRSIFVHLADPFYSAWLYKTVDVEIRGRFMSLLTVVGTAVSIPFSYLVGWYFDSKMNAGAVKIAFLVFLALTAIFGVAETVSLLKVPNRLNPQENSKGKEQLDLKGMLKEREFWILILMYIPWWMATYSYSPYLSLFQLDTLKFSVKYITVLGVVGSVVATVSVWFWGWFVDRTSFQKMFTFTAPLTVGAFLLGAFLTEKNGHILYIVFLILLNFFANGVSFGHSGLAFSLMSGSRGTLAYGICQGFGGLFGFLTTLVISCVRTAVEQNGNRVFGISAYPQQVNFVISAVLMLVSSVIVYIELKKIKLGFNVNRL